MSWHFKQNDVYPDTSSKILHVLALRAKCFMSRHFNQNVLYHILSLQTKYYISWHFRILYALKLQAKCCVFLPYKQHVVYPFMNSFFFFRSNRHSLKKKVMFCASSSSSRHLRRVTTSNLKITTFILLEDCSEESKFYLVMGVVKISLREKAVNNNARNISALSLSSHLYRVNIERSANKHHCTIKCERCNMLRWPFIW